MGIVIATPSRSQCHAHVPGNDLRLLKVTWNTQALRRRDCSVAPQQRGARTRRARRACRRTGLPRRRTTVRELVPIGHFRLHSFGGFRPHPADSEVSGSGRARRRGNEVVPGGGEPCWHPVARQAGAGWTYQAMVGQGVRRGLVAARQAVNEEVGLRATGHLGPPDRDRSQHASARYDRVTEFAQAEVMVYSMWPPAATAYRSHNNTSISVWRIHR